MEDWRSVYVLVKIQVRLGPVLNSPVPDFVKVFARMSGSHVSKELVLLLTPFPVDCADV